MTSDERMRQIEEQLNDGGLSEEELGKVIKELEGEILKTTSPAERQKPKREDEEDE